MVSRVLWSPEGLVEVRVSWSRHPRYKKKSNAINGQENGPVVGDGARKGLIMMVKQSHTRPFSWSSNFRHYLHHLMSPNYFGKSLNLIRNSTVSIIYIYI